MAKRVRMRSAADEKFVYYDYDGLPAYAKRGRIPMKVIGGKAKPVYDLFDFDHTAVRITEEKYKALVKQS